MVRFKVPETGQVTYVDKVFGEVVTPNAAQQDFVCLRSDGIPLYNFGAVVDDVTMGITLVARGRDHMVNTPLQLMLYEALGAKAPEMAHLPMMLAPNGEKLSKRHGAVSVTEYRDQGYSPDAVLNYLARFGWSHGDQEVFSLDEMIELFEVDHINLSASTFNPDKLLWLNHHYLMHGDPVHVAHHLRWHLGQFGIDPTTGPDPVDVVKAQRERNKTLVDMAMSSLFLYRDLEAYDEKASQKHLTAESAELLQELHGRLRLLPTWEKEPIHEAIESTAQSGQVKMGAVAQPLRVAVSGTTVSPPIDTTLVLLGKDRTLERIVQAITFIRKKD